MSIYPLQFFRIYTRFVAFLFVSNCSLSGPLRVDPKADRYKLGALPAGWQKQITEQKNISSDEVFFHHETGAFVSFNSLCRRYPDSSLQRLTKPLLVPIVEYQIEEQNKIIVDEREALFTRARGTLDGVPVEALFVVLRKNECVFDFSIFSKNQIGASDEKVFESFYNRFRYLGGVKE